MLGATRYFVVNFLGGAIQQKQAPKKQNQVTAAETVSEYRKKIFFETDDPRDGKQQCDAQNQGDAQSVVLRLALYFPGKFARNDCNKYDVVYAQHHLE